MSELLWAIVDGGARVIGGCVVVIGVYGTWKYVKGDWGESAWGRWMSCILNLWVLWFGWQLVTKGIS